MPAEVRAEIARFQRDAGTWAAVAVFVAGVGFYAGLGCWLVLR